jgi:hypothetical protein
MGQGVSSADAIDQLDSADSDGDGVPNGVEIMRVRHDDAEQRGYNPGLIGDTGTDPCGESQLDEVTGVPETPGPPDVPTISEWGVAAMALLLATAGSVLLTRRRWTA